MVVTGVDTATGMVTVNSKEVRRRNNFLMPCRALRCSSHLATPRTAPHTLARTTLAVRGYLARRGGNTEVARVITLIEDSLGGAMPVRGVPEVRACRLLVTLYNATRFIALVLALTSVLPWSWVVPGIKGCLSIARKWPRSETLSPSTEEKVC